MSATYFTNTTALLLCYGLDDSESLRDIEFWDNLFEENKMPSASKTIKYLIALKSDLVTEEANLNKSEG